MTIIAGVMGWPITHSRSPLLHRFWIERAGVDAVYLPFATPPDRLAEAVSGLSALGIRGVNVTIPHKEQALALADEPTAAASAIGAANMLTVGADGRLLADNSDAFGFIAHLRASVGSALDKLLPAVILGAGGVARAIAYALTDAGVGDVRIHNRTHARAAALAASFPSVVVVPDAQKIEALREARLIVNATALGMGDGALPCDPAILRSDSVVYDTVYTPLDTPLLHAARARNLHTVDGLGMLMHQARAGARLWYGVETEPDAALRALLEASFA